MTGCRQQHRKTSSNNQPAANNHNNNSKLQLQWCWQHCGVTSLLRCSKQQWVMVTTTTAVQQDHGKEHGDGDSKQKNRIRSNNQRRVW